MPLLYFNSVPTCKDKQMGWKPPSMTPFTYTSHSALHSNTVSVCLSLGCQNKITQTR